MKKSHLILVILMLSAISVKAQSPEKMSYQAIVRNPNGTLVVNKAIGIKISIQKWVLALPKPYYSSIYAETQTPSTNENGLVSIAIGTGTLVEGSILFKNIDWGSESLYLKTEIDPSGATAYSITSTTQLLSVPYALHAKTALMADAAQSLSISGATYTPQYVVDIDGNAYKTIKIGTQVWMAENLKVTHYRNGDEIANKKENISWGISTVGAWCDYNNLALNGSKYGHLYNWYAVSDPRKIAPEGWHVSTDAEWTTLQDYLIENGGNWDETTYDNKIGISLASNTNWNSSTTKGDVGYAIHENNSSGFDALPGSSRNFDGLFKYIGSYSYWWTTASTSATNAINRSLYGFRPDLMRASIQKTCGYSVRCIKD